MSRLLEKTVFTVDDNLDFVTIRFGQLSARIGYRIGFTIEHHLRLAAKQAARFDRAPPQFWREMDLDDLNDCPPPSRVPRQSRLAPTVSGWAVHVDPPLVVLQFDDMAVEMDYETAITCGHAIRRASRRAKAWAGDTSKYNAMLGMLTDAEEDYKLGIA